jgi:hypothetical protein
MTRSLTNFGHAGVGADSGADKVPPRLKAAAAAAKTRQRMAHAQSRRKLKKLVQQTAVGRTDAGGGFSVADSAIFSLPFFAAGYATATDTLHTVLAQSLYDREVVRFAEELLCPSPDAASLLLLV